MSREIYEVTGVDPTDDGVHFSYGRIGSDFGAQEGFDGRFSALTIRPDIAPQKMPNTLASGDIVIMDSIDADDKTVVEVFRQGLQLFPPDSDQAKQNAILEKMATRIKWGGAEAPSEDMVQEMRTLREARIGVPIVQGEGREVTPVGLILPTENPDGYAFIMDNGSAGHFFMNTLHAHTEPTTYGVLNRGLYRISTNTDPNDVLAESSKATSIPDHPINRIHRHIIASMSSTNSELPHYRAEVATAIKESFALGRRKLAEKAAMPQPRRSQPRP